MDDFCEVCGGANALRNDTKEAGGVSTQCGRPDCCRRTPVAKGAVLYDEKRSPSVVTSGAGANLNDDRTLPEVSFYCNTCEGTRIGVLFRKPGNITRYVCCSHCCKDTLWVHPRD
jgi:hypothetical protein